MIPVPSGVRVWIAAGHTDIENAYATMRRIHVYLDNARYHHARVVQDWMRQPGRRIVLHFILSYCPHLNPIERLWGVMHQNVTHNRYYATFKEFAEAILTFLKGNRPEALRSVLIPTHRQLPHPRSKRFSGRRGIGVYSIPHICRCEVKAYSKSPVSQWGVEGRAAPWPGILPLWLTPFGTGSE